MSKKSTKKEVRFLQTQNPRTKAWIKIDAKNGKVISTKKTPGKYKGIKVAKLARPTAQPAPSRVTPKVKSPVKDLKRKSSPKKKIVKKPKAKLKEPKIDENTRVSIESAKQRIASLTQTHLGHVERETGKIIQADHDYCKELGDRMLRKQFPGVKF